MAHAQKTREGRLTHVELATSFVKSPVFPCAEQENDEQWISDFATRSPWHEKVALPSPKNRSSTAQCASSLTALGVARLCSAAVLLSDRFRAAKHRRRSADRCSCDSQSTDHVRPPR